MINGELIDLEAGSYQARVATSGAMLVHLRHEGRDLVIPFDAERTLPAGWQGKTLVPWPNRIKGAAYTYADQTFPVPCNEPATGSALHGLVGWSDFEVLALLDAAGQEIEDADGAEDGDGVESREDGASLPAGVVLGLTLPASYGYPWSLQVEVRFLLDAAAGLTATVTGTNLGAGAAACASAPGLQVGSGQVAVGAPYGVSVHPYLTRSVPLDECVLTVPAASVLDVDPRTMAPTTLRPVEGGPWDWREGRLVGATATDNAYTDLPEGTWQVRLTGGEGGHSVVMSAQVPWVQVYSADGMERQGVAVEPMTCPPDAFNSGQDLVVLEVGQSHTFTYRLHEED